MNGNRETAAPSAPGSGASSLVAWGTWPLLFIASCAITKFGLDRGIDGDEIVAGVYLLLAFTLSLLERSFPHEANWNHSDGELRHDVVFTLIGSGLPGALAHAAVLAVFVGVGQWIARHAGHPLWPESWPTVLQVMLVFVVSDFGAYWAHRLFHEVPWLWPYHAVHHSVRRLWWLNTGRAHPTDTAGLIVFSFPILVMLGVTEEMVVWLGVLTTTIGLLSHTNVELRCGVLDWIFNTPGVHRWHHSRIVAEGNRNYGENLMLWDLVFGTHFLPRSRRPPADVGTETFVPATILGQFVQPFEASVQAAIDAFGGDRPQGAANS